MGVNVDDVFSYCNSETGKCITVETDGLGISFEYEGQVKSIQYWYFDDSTAYQRQYAIGAAYTYDSAKCAYHFVIGVNITAEDVRRGHVEIYITQATNRDKRVFNQSNGEVAGTIKNFVNEDGSIDAANAKYDEI